MTFFHSFADELIKTANPSVGKLMRAIRMARGGASAAAGARGGLSAGKALLLTGGAGAGAATLGELHGKKKGKKRGYDEGTSDVEQVATRARALGRQEGVLAYHQALQARLRDR